MSKYIKLEDAINELFSIYEKFKGSKEGKAIRYAIGYLQDLPTIEPDEDYVSRKHALEVIDDCINYPTNGDKACAIKNAPSVVPSRAEGEWAVEERDSYFGKKIMLTCSECGDVFSVTESEYPNERYCRYCGAKMKGVDNE